MGTPRSAGKRYRVALLTDIYRQVPSENRIRRREPLVANVSRRCSASNIASALAFAHTQQAPQVNRRIGPALDDRLQATINAKPMPSAGLNLAES